MPSRSESKHLRALGRRKERRDSGEFLLEGPRVLSDVLDAGHPVTLVLYTEEVALQPDGGHLLERLAAAGIRSELVTERQLAGYADTVTPQGWIAVMPIPKWGWPDREPARLLVLDAVQDPGNVGTLIRAADALGATGVILLPGTADPWGSKAVRAAAGSSVRIPVVECSWSQARDRLSAAKIETWVAAPDGEPLSRNETLRAGVALVLGNEGAGVSRAIRHAADRRVAIRMSGGIDSLNVALAGAILMDRLFGG